MAQPPRTYVTVKELLQLVEDTLGKDAEHALVAVRDSEGELWEIQEIVTECPNEVIIQLQ